MSQTKTETPAKVGEKQQLRQELLRMIVKNEQARRRLNKPPTP